MPPICGRRGAQRLGTDRFVPGEQRVIRQAPQFQCYCTGSSRPIDLNKLEHTPEVVTRDVAERTKSVVRSLVTHVAPVQQRPCRVRPLGTLPM